MQDIHSLVGGPLFGGGDPRLRPNHHHQNHQALKCPRCESSNTKFCYFNNYNLSQPRHFCKSCRRYWTKGGVLRNVPVGGGCRKSKRSKSKSSSSENRRKSNSHSSSESSSLTANTTAATTASTTTAAATEAVSASSSHTASTLLNSQNSRFFLPSTTNPSFDPPLIDQSSGCGIFPDIGNLTSLVTTYSEQSLLGFNASDVSYRLHQDSHGLFSRNQSSPNQAWEQQQKIVCSGVNDGLKFPEISTGFLDQTATIGLSGLQSRTSNDGLTALDWHGGGGDQGLFDLTGNVDQGYWSQTQWVDNDQSLNYLP